MPRSIPYHSFGLSSPPTSPSTSIQLPQHLKNYCNAWDLNQHRTIANSHSLSLLHLGLIKLNRYSARTGNMTFFKKNKPLIQESNCCGSLQKSCPLAMLLFVFPGWSQEAQVCFPSSSRFPSPQAHALNSKHCTRNGIFKGAHAELSNQKPILLT